MKFRICLAVYYFPRKTNAEGAGMPPNSFVGGEVLVSRDYHAERSGRDIPRMDEVFCDPGSKDVM